MPQHPGPRVNALFPVDAQRAGMHVAQHDDGRGTERHHGEAVLEKLEERNHEQVEADVVAEEGIGPPVCLRPKDAQQEVPTAVEDEAEYQGGGDGGQGHHAVGPARGGERLHFLLLLVVVAPVGGHRPGAPAELAGQFGDQAPQIHARRQDADVDPEVGEHRKERDHEQADLEEAYGPEDARVAEGLEPQVFHSPIGQHDEADDGGAHADQDLCLGGHAPKYPTCGRTITLIGARFHRVQRGGPSARPWRTACLREARYDTPLNRSAAATSAAA